VQSRCCSVVQDRLCLATRINSRTPSIMYIDYQSMDCPGYERICADAGKRNGSSKPRFGTKSKRVDSSCTARSLFKPLRTEKDQASPTLDELASTFYPECPEAVAFHYALPYNVSNLESCSDFNVGMHEACSSSVEMPLPLPAYAKQYHSASAFLANLPVYSDEERQCIEENTRLQGDCDEWFEQRLCRISASVAYRVHTSVNRHVGDSDAQNNLVRDITTDTVKICVQIPAIKHGHDTEPIAAEAYLAKLKVVRHNLRVEKCGLLVNSETPYLCASPDRLVECACCGKGLLEIKCPFTCSDGDPTKAKLDYLVKENAVLQLKVNHPYYAQI